MHPLRKEAAVKWYAAVVVICDLEESAMKVFRKVSRRVNCIRS
jgi:hypothetical protein